MRVTVFGGATPKPSDRDYQAALQLGQLLGAAGHTVLTGGYMGAMEAVSRGASEVGGHVIGVTSREIEAWRPGSVNAWVQEELPFESARERLFALIDKCDAAIALPGGAGTLAEIAILWKQMIISAPRPLILIGPGWQESFTSFFNNMPGYIPAADRALLTFMPNVEAAVKHLQSALPNL